MAVKPEDVTNVMAFDALYTTNQIQKLKVLLPYIEPSAQKHLAIYIKYMELQYTMDYVKKHPFQICGCSMHNSEKPDLKELCRQLCLYSAPEEIRQLEQMQNILQAMEQFQEMSQMMSVMQEIFPNMTDSAGADSSSASGTDSSAPGFSMMDMLMNMMTPDQRAMYEMFQGNADSSQ